MPDTHHHTICLLSQQFTSVFNLTILKEGIHIHKQDAFLKNLGAIVFFLFSFLFHIEVLYPHIVLWTMFMADAVRGQKRVLGPMELELKVVMSCHVGIGN